MSGLRREREAAGRRAEAFAALWLQLKGYRILARRYRAPSGEIDLIAGWPLFGAPKRIAFVEVKQRREGAALAEAIGPAQRRRIEAAAAAFLGQTPRLAGAVCAFDAVFIAPGGLPRHVRDLWREGE